MITLILLVFSFVCFAIATAWSPRDYPRSLIAAGLAFYMASLLFARAVS